MTNHIPIYGEPQVLEFAKISNYFLNSKSFLKKSKFLLVFVDEYPLFAAFSLIFECLREEGRTEIFCHGFSQFQAEPRFFCGRPGFFHGRPRFFLRRFGEEEGALKRPAHDRHTPVQWR